jgi:hypothetical protein
VNGEDDDLLEPLGRCRQKLLFLLQGQPPFDDVVDPFLPDPHDGVVIDPLPFLHGEIEGVTHQNELVIDGPGRDSLFPSLRLVVRNHLGLDLGQDHLAKSPPEMFLQDLVPLV